MQTTRANLGIATADAERVAIQFVAPDLVLTFIDWREQPCKLVFNEILAFRWQEFDEQNLRDDTTYEVVDSDWLRRQALLQSVDAAGYAHYKLGFNACGCLDVLARRILTKVNESSRSSDERPHLPGNAIIDS